MGALSMTARDIIGALAIIALGLVAGGAVNVGLHMAGWMPT